MGLRLMLVTAALSGCGLSGSDVEGEWAVTSWSIRVADGGSVVFEEEVTDVGSIRFAGDGHDYDNPMVFDAVDAVELSEGVWEVRPKLAATLWTIDGDSLRFAWNQDFSSPEILTLTDVSDDRLEGDSTETESGFVVRETTRHYVLERR